MRKSPLVDALMPRTRREILAATVMRPDRWWYQSDLARHMRVPPSSLQRELNALVNAGILRKRKDGNRVYFQPDPECPILSELQSIMTKTAGLLDVLRDCLDPFRERIAGAFVFGSIARGGEVATSDVDLMVIGEAGLSDLAPVLRNADERLGRTVNATVYTAREFATKVRAGNHFLRAVLDGERLLVVGGEHDLAEITRRKPRRRTPDEQAGNRRTPKRRSSRSP